MDELHVEFLTGKVKAIDVEPGLAKPRRRRSEPEGLMAEFIRAHEKHAPIRRAMFRSHGAPGGSRHGWFGRSSAALGVTAAVLVEVIEPLCSEGDGSGLRHGKLCMQVCRVVKQ
jgi:hypothetical protein